MTSAVQFRTSFWQVSALLYVGLVSGCMTPVADPVAPATSAIIDTYISIAQASYGDALLTAQQLQQAVDTFLAQPSARTQLAAQEAWRAARIPYPQTEAFRFGNAVVDAWEARVNSWPLDEGLIDYVAPAYGTESDNNYFYTANIIANPLLDIEGISVDAADITPQLLGETLHELDGVDTNVATGYHAIEFLLWGQDLNGTNPGAGARPYTDYSLEACTHGNCDRRRAYLESATSLLVTDLEEMVQDWAPDGAAYTELRSKGDGGGIAAILTGMGSLAYGELAGERVRLGLLLHDPEEEHDCFSDNTHWSHFYDAKGISNVYRGEYTRVNGDRIDGASLEDLIRAQAPALHAEMSARLEATELGMTELAEKGEAGQTYDVLIASNNAEGEELINRIVNALMEETRTIEKIINQLQLQNISIEGSDSLPPPQ
jgi:putative iron-regulated protein